MFRYHYLPLAPLFYVGLALLLVLAIVWLEVGVLRHAYRKMGVSRRWVYGVLALCLLGSYINIPVTTLRGRQVTLEREVSFFGVTYRIPEVEETPDTVLAVNLGGAVIPTILALYLALKNRLFLEGFLGVTVVSILVHMMAQPVPQVGIAVPIFMPPIAAALVAIFLRRERAAPLAFVSGTLGTLIGADLSNLDKIAGLGAPIASIGGAGTFDGIFVTGVLAVLLA